MSLWSLKIKSSLIYLHIDTVLGCPTQPSVLGKEKHIDNLYIKLHHRPCFQIEPVQREQPHRSVGACFGNLALQLKSRLITVYQTAERTVGSTFTAFVNKLFWGEKKATKKTDITANPQHPLFSKDETFRRMTCKATIA